MAAHQCHRTGIRFVQRRIIDDEQTCAQRDTALHLLPQRVAIRRQALQQARVGVMRHLVLTVGMAAGRFQRAEHLLCGHQKVDVVVFSTFWSVHAAQFRSPSPAA